MTSKTVISPLTTVQMTGYAKTWLATQANSTPRDILQQLHDMTVPLLGVYNPPNPVVTVGEITIETPQLIELANKWLDEHQGLSPYDFLVQIRNGTLAIIQQLPKWKCSMFFRGSNGKVDSSLDFAAIDGSESASHRKYICDAIRRNGGDTLLFIAEKLLNNPTLQAEVDAYLMYGAGVGIKHLILDIKNDNSNLSRPGVIALARQLAKNYSWADSEKIALMFCLEADEIASLEEVVSVVVDLKTIVPLWRMIVGSGSIEFLKALGRRSPAELWLEIQTDPFELSQADADKYIANLQSLLPYGPVWAGEFWDGSSELSKYISRRALEIGCAGVGSWVG